MCKRAWNNLRSSFSKLDTLLAWFAVFVWVVYFTQSFTGLDGFINFIQRATSGDWLGFKPIVGGVWYMYVASGVYWGGLALGIMVFIFLIRKLFTKHKEDETIERIERDLRDIKKSIDNLASEIRQDRENKTTTKKMKG